MDKTPPQGTKREIELGSSSGTKVEVPAALGRNQGAETGNPSKNLVGILKSHSRNSAVSSGAPHKDLSQYEDLLRALHKGDWASVEVLIRQMDPVNARISSNGETALHVAVMAGHVHIVKALMGLMSEKDLEIRDNGGATAMAHAASFGYTGMVKCMHEKNHNLVSMVETNMNRLPVAVAMEFGYVEAARYLFSVTPLQDLMPEKGRNGSMLITSSIWINIFDIPLALLQICPQLSLLGDMYGFTPLFALACRPSAFPSGSHLVFWKRWIYACIPIPSAQSTTEVRIDIHKSNEHPSEQIKIARLVRGLLQWLISSFLRLLGIKQIYDLKLLHAQSRELLHQMCGEIKISGAPKMIRGSLFRATKEGIVEFIVDVLRANPDLLWCLDGESRTIFSFAVLRRQAKVFSLIYGLDSRNQIVSCNADKYENSILHVAGMLQTSTPLDRVAGAALKMQRELQWFKEVERIVPPNMREGPKKNMTARDVFTRDHKDMVKEGETWMKETATSCTVVGALIITVVFAVPGGNDQNTGYPMLSQKKLFMVFIVSDALSLFSSSTSVLMFLGILTSRYAEEDVLESLPKKMIIGLSTLFFSIATMMITFCAALFVLLPKQSWLVIPIICLASVPVTLFVFIQFPLLVEMFSSTYGPSIFNRKMKRWL